MYWQRENSLSTKNSHGNTISQKEKNSSPETKLKVMEDCDLTDREFKISVMKKFSVLQENSERQFNELRNKSNEPKEYFTKEIETLKRNQVEILELHNSIHETKNTLQSTGNRVDQMKERISKLKTESRNDSGRRGERTKIFLK